MDIGQSESKKGGFKHLLEPAGPPTLAKKTKYLPHREAKERDRREGLYSTVQYKGAEETSRFIFASDSPLPDSASMSMTDKSAIKGTV